MSTEPSSLSPSLRETLFSPAAAFGWVVLGVGAVCSVFAIAYTWRTCLPHSDRQRECIALAAFFVAVFGGMFLVLGVADPWGSALLHWYLGAEVTLEALHCSTTAVTGTYTTLQGIEDAVRAGGVALGVAGFLSLYVYRFVMGRHTAQG